MRLRGEDPRDDDRLQALSNPLDPFELRDREGEPIGEFIEIYRREIDISIEPCE